MILEIDSLNTPIDASLINLGIIAAPNICDNLPIRIEDGLEIYEVETTIYDNPDSLTDYDSFKDYDKETSNLIYSR